MPDPIIHVENLSKAYRIGSKEVIPTGALGTLKQMVKSPFQYLASTLREPAPEEMIWALKDVSFEVYPGEVVGIIGRNGAGKSTLLKILSRITKPTSGFAEIRGRVASLLEVGTGFHPELTGRENVYLNGTILGMTKREVDAKFDEIVDFSGVEKFIDTPVKRYSSGMQVRLAFAVAAYLEPDLLIVDEVLAVGDIAFQDKCLGKVEQISQGEGRTVLFVSHQMGTLARICQRGILMQSGSIIQDNIVEKVINTYLQICSLSESDGSYKYESTKEPDKDIFFVEAYTCDHNSLKKNSFRCDESVFVELGISVREMHSNAKVCVALLNRASNRVFTLIRDLNEYCSDRNKSTDILAKVKFPPNLIAPNNYSLACAIFTPNGKTYDFLDSVCPFKVYDSGTEFCIFEGLDYGSILVQGEWS